MVNNKTCITFEPPEYKHNWTNKSNRVYQQKDIHVIELVIELSVHTLQVFNLLLDHFKQTIWQNSGKSSK